MTDTQRGGEAERQILIQMWRLQYSESAVCKLELQEGRWYDSVQVQWPEKHEVKGINLNVR